MRNVFLMILLSVIPFSMLMAAGQQDATTSDGTENGSVTISMNTWLIQEGASEGAIFDMVALFEEEHPNINVELVGVPYAQTLQQAVVAVQGGNPPDVLHLTPQFSASLAAMGALHDLGEYVSSDEIDQLPEAAYQAGVIDESLISLPWQAGPIFVLAWKDLLNQAGYESVPETWPEFRRAVEDISNLGQGTYGFGARTDKSANSAFWFFIPMWGMGGHFLDENGDVDFNNQGTVAALDWYRELGTENMTPQGMGVKEVRNLFAQGKVGFMFDGPWMRGILRTISGRGDAIDDDYIVAEVPRSSDGQRRTIANNHVLSVAENSPNKAAAVELVKFLTQNEEVSQLYYERAGAMPVNQALLNNPAYQDDYGRVVRDSLAYADALPSTNPRFRAALDHIATAMQEAILGGEAEAAASLAQERLEESYNDE